MKPSDSTAQTNWKFLGIVAVLAVFAGGGILFLQIQREDAAMGHAEQMPNRWPPASEEELSVETEANEEVSITLVSPNGGETWTIGEERTVRWEVQNAPPDSYVRLDIVSEIWGTAVLKGVSSKNGMAMLKVPISTCAVEPIDTCLNVPPAGDYTATITLYTGPPLYCVHLCPGPNVPPVVSHASDTSDAHFRVLPGPPTIAWISPLRGNADTKVTISGWGFLKTGNRVRFDRQEIATVDSVDGTTLTFTVPDTIASGHYSISVVNANGIENVGHGYWSFTVTEGVGEQPITISYPNGGETLIAGQSYNITWKSNDDINKVIVSLYKAFGKRISWIDTVEASLGTYTWVVPSDLESGSHYFINVNQKTPHKARIWYARRILT